jgi:hypothetical protein
MHLHPSWAFKTISDLNARIIKEPEVLLENIGALPLLQMAYRGQVQLTPQQMRAAIEALPFEVPKLGVTANVTVDGSFAERLERALERSAQSGLLLPPTIEHEPLVSANDLKKPFQSYRRA